MFESLGQLFERASTPGDLATVLVFGTAGFLVDAGLNAVGFLEPGVVGITSASGALGVKKSIEAALTARRERKRERWKRIDEMEKVESERRAEIKRAEELLTLLGNEALPLKQRLELEIKFFQKGIIEIDAFKVRIDEIVNDYRSS